MKIDDRSRGRMNELLEFQDDVALLKGDDHDIKLLDHIIRVLYPHYLSHEPWSESFMITDLATKRGVDI